jgi:hypothetical protein
LSGTQFLTLKSVGIKYTEVRENLKYNNSEMTGHLPKVYINDVIPVCLSRAVMDEFVHSSQFMGKGMK